MDLSEFLRIHPMRTPNIMWLLGAGASVSARIPTAYDMIWDFKRSLYCTGERVSLKSCDDLSNPNLRAKIQRYCETLPKAPKLDSDEEYSYYFEMAYATEMDRRKYIDQMVSRAKPSFGHIVLATLLKLDRIRYVWTTNFDRNVEDAANPLLVAPKRLITSTIADAATAVEALNEGRSPLFVKLHGDFQARQLKNTSDELIAQNSNLQHALVQGCSRFGLAAVGYSGRDHSVMDALESAIQNGKGFPSGLFWFARSAGAVLPRVTQLISRASESGIDAHLIEIETFDELMGDILRLTPGVSDEDAKVLDEFPRRLTSAPIPSTSGSWPLIRLNAFPITVAPTLCRKIGCKIGGAKEVREATKAAGVKVLSARRNVGVLAFGPDEDLRKAFGSYDISEFGVHSIEPHRLRYESAEQGLLNDACVRAISRTVRLPMKRRSRQWIVTVNPTEIDQPKYAALRGAARDLTGVVPGTSTAWREAARLKIDYRLDHLWLVLEPAVLLGEMPDKATKDVCKEFVRSRKAGRFNSSWSLVLDGWAALLFGTEHEREFKAFGTGEGMDAVFKLARRNAFSLRGSVR